MNYELRIKKNRNSGYTIVETMIAVSLFLVITTIGMGSLLNTNLIHQKSQDMRSILDNLSFIMEDMSRNLRTGSSYHCFVLGDTIPSSTSPVVSTPKSCVNGWALAFESS
ncbi:MAG: prepilin-type N-terminal cleavage/methylation domain-containing protein, partial [Candidatus Parcubacteria bacterium]|nr:prepilin-type N-terminal cleavage/methylation domain-containing protein [Candidatus Parcubacteria bacterium]